MFEPKYNERFLIQPSLEIGKEDDEHEKEANAVADKVMRMGDGTKEEEEKGKLHDSGSKMQKMVQPKEDEERKKMVQPKEDEEKKKMVDTPSRIQKMVDTPALYPKMVDLPRISKKTTGVNDGMTASKNVEQGINSSKGGGQSLSPEVQQEMGSKMGADFSGVKVHTDESAVQMNREVGAKAFTHGNDIYFNQGQYNPETSQGKHLLAHELTHTVQQNQKISKKIQRQSDPGTAFGSINPARLIFVEVVPYTPPGPGGWRAVSVIVSFLYTSLSGIFTGSYYRRQEISMEIGVPIKTYQGNVSVSFAQICSAAAMNAAAQVISEEGILGSPTAVTSMRSLTEATLKLSIPGARVSAPITRGLVPIRL